MREPAFVSGPRPTKIVLADTADGVAPPGSASEAVQACRTALADGTRGGLIAPFLFYVRASAHYFLAAAGMARHLRERGA